MLARAQSAFQTIRTEGALLPADLLKRIADGDKSLDGLTPESYHLDASERINEVTNRAWTACRDAWQRFQKMRSELPESDKGTTLTRDRWLLKLFQELGYGRLQTAKAIEIDGKTYPISHAWNNVPMHLISFRYDLDHAVKDIARVSAHSLVQELLNRTEDNLWGFVSNGLQLRILRDNVSFTRAAYVEFDLEDMMEGEVYSDFVLLWLLCHQSRVEAEKNEQCWLEKWHQAAKQQGTRALDHLRDGVQKAIEVFGQGFLDHRANALLRAKLADGSLTTQQYYQQLLRLVYRLIFLFVAEDRDLLLLSTADAKTRERYEKHYSLSRIRRLAERRRGTRHADLWQGIRLIFGLLYKGDPRLGLPALGSMLFSARAMPDLDGCELANDALLEAIRHLAFTQEGKVLRQVDYRNLGSEELGSVYESLLELHPDVNTDAARFELATVAGSERKTTGSYYTPSSLINCLLDSALDPVVDEAIKTAKEKAKTSKTDPAAEIEKAILNLKVCDPACGSGHFLIAAANRLAHRLATIRTGDDEPSPAARRAAFRDVVGRCIYGVDINPMAVELCKVNLWLESIDPGKPLSFLDHRILCGNSLIGAPPRLIKEGIPDDAFKPIEGDDKAVCSEYKRRNKDERKGQMHFEWGAMPEWKLGNLTETFASVVAAQDDSLEAVETKEQRYAEFVKSVSYENARLLADAWCAAFVWKKDKSTSDCITTEWIRRIEANPHSLPPWMKQEIARLRRQYRFLHWHLEFPDVFRPAEQRMASGEWRMEQAGNGLAAGEPLATHHSPLAASPQGWLGGFDCVLGNPPWERIKLQEKEFFAARNPDIANAPNASTRRRMIAMLPETDPPLYQAFQEALRRADGESTLVRDTGRYPLCGRGDVNTYSIFAELKRSLLNPSGRVGCIVPSGIATDDTTKFFFQDLIETGSLVSLYDFENRKGIFPGVHRSYKFCLLTMRAPEGQRMANSEWRMEDKQHPNSTDHSPLAIRHSPPADFVFFALDTSDLADPERHFSLTPDEIALLNPNTRTCPIFRSRADAELTKAIYRRVPVLIKEARDGRPEENPWGISFLRMFDMSNDSHLFRTRQQLEAEGFALEGNIFRKRERIASGDWRVEEYLPLYEAKMIWHFDHRWATYDGLETRDLSLSEKQDPHCVVLPRYWVRSQDVSAALANTGWNRKWLLGWRRITNATNERTFAASVFSACAAGDNIFLLLSISNPHLRYSTVALSSLAFDFVARQKLGGTNMLFFLTAQLPVLVPAVIDRPCFWITSIAPPHSLLATRHSPPSLRDWLLPRVLELTYTAWDLEPFARDCGYDGPPFIWDEERRFLIRCELDAAFFHLYLPSEANGEWRMANRDQEDRDHSPFATRYSPLNETPEQLAELKKYFPAPRDAVAYIMETFPIVKRKDVEKYGSYRTKETILEIYDEMQAVMRANGEWRMANGKDRTDLATRRSPLATYRSRLDPPPGPPTNPDGSFAPLPEWKPGAPKPRNWPPHIHPPRGVQP